MGDGFAKPAINYLNSLVGDKIKAILKFEDKHAWLDYMLTNNELVFGKIAQLKTSDHEQLEFKFEDDSSRKNKQLKLIFTENIKL